MTDFWNQTGRWYDKQGQPITMLQWSELHNDREYTILAKDVFVMGDQPVEVSTVWLGLNHSFGDGPPVIFETMVFGGDLDLDCWRYHTEEEARAGHAEVVKLVQVLCAAKDA